MHVTKTELQETLDLLSTAFAKTDLPPGQQLSPECVDCIRDSLQSAISSFESLYKEIQGSEITMNYAELIRTLRHFRNTQMCLRVNKDRFQAQADRFYETLQTLYTQDLEIVLRNEDLHSHEECRRHVNETARSLHVAAASFGVCVTPKDPLLAMAVAD